MRSEQMSLRASFVDFCVQQARAICSPLVSNWWQYVLVHRAKHRYFSKLKLIICFFFVISILSQRVYYLFIFLICEYLWHCALGILFSLNYEWQLCTFFPFFDFHLLSMTIVFHICISYFILIGLSMKPTDIPSP